MFFGDWERSRDENSADGILRSCLMASGSAKEHFISLTCIDASNMGESSLSLSKTGDRINYLPHI